MEDEIAKWFNESILRIVEKLKSGQELTSTESYIALTYIYAQSFEKKLTELERNLRDEIRKTREELLVNDDKVKKELIEYVDKTKKEIIEYVDRVKSELLNNDERIKKELLENDERIKKELIEYVDKTRKELLENDERIKKELLENQEKTKKELLENDERIKKELIEYVDKTRKELLENDERIKKELLISDENIKKELEVKIEEVRSEVSAVRSDLGVLTESFFVTNFLSSIKEAGEKIANVYRQYETSAGEVDALVETDKAVYIIEVKFKAEIKDVDALLTKAKEVEKEYQGKRIIPVLTGPKISKAVRGYAKGLNIMIFQ
ncbi:hypothetical protein EWF20_07445 [Sulfolobus sp. S-194]|uniref:hypothetical protein n=1 Tax=Sulfolobus sp. S-194 TaxID=2512240 RepID=UPI0014370B95|nr:hypothetical protein [Sulfolobus sp. S-194]QIW24001.1 hypothetical protein EWF20_07445 [Sulfolobus sp. S-194]